MTSLRRETSLPPWGRRRRHIDPYISESMCAVLGDVRINPSARSLAAVKPANVHGIDIEPHPGWTLDEQRKIDRYVNQMDLLDTDRVALQAPRFKGWYRYHCEAVSCGGHRQGILDWEFVALQRTLGHLDDDGLVSALRGKFFTEMCDQSREVAFFVGNQAKHPRTFGVIGVYWPPHHAGTRRR